MEELEALIDTDILIDFLRGTQDINVHAHISSVSAFELLFGAHRSGRKHNLDTTRTLLERTHVLPFTEITADIAAQIHAELTTKGTPIDTRDLFIAASAIEHNLPIHTNNKKHFSKIPDLELI